MCIDTDLFGEVIITYEDIATWLRTVPRFNDDTRKSAIAEYVNGYDVVNKIKRAKLNNSFYCLNDSCSIDKPNLSHTLESVIKPRFKPLPFITYAQQQKRASL